MKIFLKNNVVNKKWRSYLNNIKSCFDSNKPLTIKMKKWISEQKYRLNCNGDPERKELWNDFMLKYYCLKN